MVAGAARLAGALGDQLCFVNHMQASSLRHLATQHNENQAAIHNFFTPCRRPDLCKPNLDYRVCIPDTRSPISRGSVPLTLVTSISKTSREGRPANNAGGSVPEIEVPPKVMVLIEFRYESSTGSVPIRPAELGHPTDQHWSWVKHTKL